MKIPRDNCRDYGGKPDGTIQKGPRQGRDRFYRDALYSTLVALQPTICLEIGTHHAQSTHVFQNYFDKYKSQGLLVTCDICQYKNLAQECRLPNVQQLEVYPHIVNIGQYHNLDAAKMIKFTNKDIENSVLLNTQRILEYAPVFDFCFLDGDHNLVSLLKDLQIAKNVLKYPQYILLDDTEEWNCDVARYYWEVIRMNQELECYDFEDWPCLVGAALIQDKQNKTEIPKMIQSVSIQIKKED